VAFDVIFAKDSVLPAPGCAPSRCRRRINRRTTSATFAISNASQLTATGAPTGGYHGVDDIYFPFAPALHAADHLRRSRSRAWSTSTVDRGAVHLRAHGIIWSRWRTRYAGFSRHGPGMPLSPVG